MKRCIVAFLFVLSYSVGSAQLPSDCRPIPALEALYRDEVADMAMERIYKLRLADTAFIEIPQAFQDTIMRELAAVCNLGARLEADSVFRAYCVHRSEQRRFMPVHLSFQVDTSEAWAKQWFLGHKQSGNASLDALLRRHGVVQTDYQFEPGFPGALNHIATLSATRAINMNALVDSLMSFRGAVAWWFPPRYGDADYIAYIKDSQAHFTFIAGWGDCPMGCTSAKIWRYTVNPDDCSVRLDTAYFAGDRERYKHANCDLIPATAGSEEQVESLRIVPNPATTTIQLRSTGFRAGHYRIMDLGGRLLQHGPLPTGEIDVRSLQPGLYMLVVTSDSGERNVQRFSKM